MWYAAAAAVVCSSYPKPIWFIVDEIAQSSYILIRLAWLVTVCVHKYNRQSPLKKDHYSEQSFGSRGWEPIKYVDEAYF